MWAIVGLSSVAWAIWGLLTESHFRSVVESWLIVLAFGLVAIAGAATFARGIAVGRWLISIVSFLVILYAAMWLLLGGVEDAPGYWFAIVPGVGLAAYALAIARRGTRAV
jgi:hypothetical protein